MLSTLRHKGVAKKVLWFVTIIIVLSFGFFGVANTIDNSLNSAGTMYGKNVTVKEFEKAYYAARDAAIMLYGERFFKIGNQLDLEREAWDRLILSKEAKKRGIKVSDQELVAYVAQIPFFQREGKFDHTLYQMIVKNPSVFDRNLREFEEGTREQLAIRKLIETIAPDGNISDDELKKEFQKNFEKIKLSYVLFTPQEFLKDVTATEEEVKKFYEESKDQFRQPASISLDYVQLNFPDKATDADKLKVKQEALTLASQAKSEGLRSAAQKYKLTVKTSPFFSMEQPLLTFVTTPEEVEKLFTLKKGDFAAPREMPDGWQIVQVNSKRDSHIPSFEEAQSIAKEALLTQKAFEIAKSKADGALQAIKDAKDKDFKTIATSGLNLKVQETPSFGRGEYIANMGLVAQFQQETSSLTKESPLSGVIATSQGAAIVHLDNVESPSEEQFKTENESFKQQLEAQRRNQALVGFMSKLRMEANIKSKVKYR